MGGQCQKVEPNKIRTIQWPAKIRTAGPALSTHDSECRNRPPGGAPSRYPARGRLPPPPLGGASRSAGPGADAHDILAPERAGSRKKHRRARRSVRPHRHDARPHEQASPVHTRRNDPQKLRRDNARLAPSIPAEEDTLPACDPPNIELAGDGAVREQQLNGTRPAVFGGNGLAPIETRPIRRDQAALDKNGPPQKNLWRRSPKGKILINPHCFQLPDLPQKEPGPKWTGSRNKGQADSQSLRVADKGYS